MINSDSCLPAALKAGEGSGLVRPRDETQSAQYRFGIGDPASRNVEGAAVPTEENNTPAPIVSADAVRPARSLTGM